jgi:hypothetical protein
MRFTRTPFAVRVSIGMLRSRGSARKRWGLVSALLLATTAAEVRAQEDPSLSLVGSPVALEPVNIRVELLGCTHLGEVRFVGGIFEVLVEPTICGVPPGGLFPSYLTLGQLPAGDYQARLVAKGSGAVIGAPLSFQVTRAPQDPLSEFTTPSLDYSGIWWTRERNGESWFLQHFTGTDKLLGVWNRYRQDGSAAWLAILGRQIRPGEFEVTLYEPTASGLQPAGYATLTGIGPNNLRSLDQLNVLLYLIAANRSETLNLERFP